MSLLPPLTPARSLREQAYENIRESIITLELKPGQLVHENELASLLGISRTPVRDAFHLLISERLIEVLPQRTKKIAYISVNKVLESNLVRLSLESTAFKAVAANWDSSPLHIQAEKQLHSLLKQQVEAADLQDTGTFLQLDEAFHKQVMLLTGNHTLIEMVEHVRSHVNRFRFLAMKELALTKNLVGEHEELLSCLINRDEQGVVQMLEHHLGKMKSEIPPLREKFTDYFQD